MQIWSPTQDQWLNFLILTSLVVVSQLFKSKDQSQQYYQPELAIYFASLLILPYPLYLLILLCSYLVEYVKGMLVKTPRVIRWYYQNLNLLTLALTGFLIQLLLQNFQALIGDYYRFYGILALLLSALVYAGLIYLASSIISALGPPKHSQLSQAFDLEFLLTCVVLLNMGIVMALLITLNRWMILPAILPLYLMYRSLAIPLLKQQANTDSKTSLWNFKYFIQALENEIKRSTRLNRPMTVVIADLDLLRNINNAYGHLAGDAVLTGVSDMLKHSIRNYDTVARLGGEEFGILFPELYPEDAFPRVEQIRVNIQENKFTCPVTQAEIKATMSFGIAGWNKDYETARDIIHAADIALYEAKMSGRNRVKVFNAHTIPRSRRTGSNRKK
jgi:diguanylate cyclase (GGDEF)-like protein